MRSRRIKPSAVRLMDAVSFRVSPATRADLEKIADERGWGLCEAARHLLNLGIEQSKISESSVQG